MSKQKGRKRTGLPSRYLLLLLFVQHFNDEEVYSPSFPFFLRAMSVVTRRLFFSFDAMKRDIPPCHSLITLLLLLLILFNRSNMTKQCPFLCRPYHFERSCEGLIYVSFFFNYNGCRHRDMEGNSFSSRRVYFNAIPHSVRSVFTTPPCFIRHYFHSFRIL
jgi:hypothetical protein